MNLKKTAIIAASAALALGACGSDGDAGVSISDSWARTSAAGQTNGAVYFDIESADGDELVGASVPASVAAEAQIHEVVMADMAGEMTEDTMAEMTEDTMADGELAGETDDQMGEMTMQEISSLVLPAGETVAFEPGGYHVMLFGLVDPLSAGDEIEVTLDFGTADDQVITVTVSDEAP